MRLIYVLLFAIIFTDTSFGQLYSISTPTVNAVNNWNTKIYTKYNCSSNASTIGHSFATDYTNSIISLISCYTGPGILPVLTTVKTAEKITKEGAENSRYVKEGDFILSNSMSFGRPYILKISGCIHDGWLLMTDFRKDLNKDYLFEILSYEDTQLQFSHSAAGGVVKNLNKERVSSTKIPLPPKSVQDAILKEVSKFEANKNKLLKNISLRDYEETVKRMKNDILRKHLQ